LAIHGLETWSSITLSLNTISNALSLLPAIPGRDGRHALTRVRGIVADYPGLLHDIDVGGGAQTTSGPMTCRCHAQDDDQLTIVDADIST
jgi:hypothetical protein